MSGIELVDGRGVLGEEWRFVIGVFNCSPMFVVPGPFPADMDLVDRYVVNLSAMTVDRDGEPLGAMRGFDPIAVAPSPLVILDIIIKHKDIRLQDLVEITPPGDIGWLEDYTACHTRTSYLLSISLIT